MPLTRRGGEEVGIDKIDVNYWLGVDPVYWGELNMLFYIYSMPGFFTKALRDLGFIDS